MLVSVTSGIFIIPILAVLLLLGGQIAKRSAFYSTLLKPKHDTFEPEQEVNTTLKNRHEMLDGLRGFLALGVLFQHAMTNYAYFQTGIWQITDIRIYRHAGGEAVILFFLITSFLYWSKALHSKGFVSLKRLYANRFLRLAPMYLASALVVTVSILIQARFHIMSFRELFKNILSWLSLGLVTTTAVDGVSVIPVNAGIHWTLHYEWIFYLLLPFTAYALRGKYHRFIFVAIVAVVFLMHDWGYWVIFLFGMLIAYIVHKKPKFDWFRTSWVASLIPLVLLVLVYMYQYKPYSLPQYVLSSGILLSCIYGTSVFGVLRTSAARFLGTLSYSIYLLHGIVLFTVLHLVNVFIPVASLSAVSYWSIILLTGVYTVLIATITYRYIEHPFLMKKK